MSYSIKITEKAKRDIAAAADYIEYILKNPDAADYLHDEINKKISGLTEFPERIRKVDDSFLSTLGIRAVSIDNYLAFFTISESKKIVTIIRFMYEKREWSAILRVDHSL